MKTKNFSLVTLFLLSLLLQSLIPSSSASTFSNNRLEAMGYSPEERAEDTSNSAVADLPVTAGTIPTLNNTSLAPKLMMNLSSLLKSTFITALYATLLEGDAAIATCFNEISRTPCSDYNTLPTESITEGEADPKMRTDS